MSPFSELMRTSALMVAGTVTSTSPLRVVNDIALSATTCRRVAVMPPLTVLATTGPETPARRMAPLTLVTSISPSTPVTSMSPSLTVDILSAVRRGTLIVRSVALRHDSVPISTTLFFSSTSRPVEVLAIRRRPSRSAGLSVAARRPPRKEASTTTSLPS